MRDVAGQVQPSPMMKLRKHTAKSRAVWLLSLSLLVVNVVWAQLTTPNGEAATVSSITVLAALGLQWFGRRWQIEILRPRPQTAEDRRAYRHLQIIQVAAIAPFVALIIWFLLDPVGSSWHSEIGLLAGLGFVAFIGLQFLMARASERLFTRIAQRDGAYGF